jgi:hypothetical protein
MVIDRVGPHLGRSRISARQFLYSSAFELGRHLIGYEVQKVLAAVDWYAKAETNAADRRRHRCQLGRRRTPALYRRLDPRIRQSV